MSSFSGIMGKSVGPEDGLLSVSQGLAEGDTEVGELCPSVFVCVPIVLFVCVYLCMVYRVSLLLAQNVL